VPYNDLRAFIDRLEKEGELVRVRAEVDSDLEVGAIMRNVFDKRGKAILFENVKGHRMPLICGAMDTFKRYALGVDCAPHPREILKKNVEAVRKPIPPTMIEKAPCQEVVLTGDEVDLNGFPSLRKTKGGFIQRTCAKTANLTRRSPWQCQTSR